MLNTYATPPPVQAKLEELAKIKDKTEQIEALVKDLKTKRAQPDLVRSAERICLLLCSTISTAFKGAESPPINWASWPTGSHTNRTCRTVNLRTAVAGHEKAQKAQNESDGVETFVTHSVKVSVRAKLSFFCAFCAFSRLTASFRVNGSSGFPA
jgi:hypothetical protein